MTTSFSFSIQTVHYNRKRLPIELYVFSFLLQAIRLFLLFQILLDQFFTDAFRNLFEGGKLHSKFSLALGQ